MRKRLLASGLVVAFVLAAPAPARSAENVPDVLRRQTQELLDAITTGSAAVWERYADANLRYVDESGPSTSRRVSSAQRDSARGRAWLRSRREESPEVIEGGASRRGRRSAAKGPGARRGLFAEPRAGAPAGAGPEQAKPTV